MKIAFETRVSDYGPLVSIHADVCLQDETAEVWSEGRDTQRLIEESDTLRSTLEGEAVSIALDLAAEWDAEGAASDRGGLDD